MMSFRGYLYKHIKENSPIGDLARDLRDDKCLTRDTKSHTGISKHLRHAHDLWSDASAIRVLDKAYEQYKEMR